MPIPNDISESPVELLAQRVADDRLTADEYAELMLRLQGDRSAHDKFTDYLVLHAMLRRELGAYRPPTLDGALGGAGSCQLSSSQDIAASSSQPQGRRNTPMRYLFASIAAVLLVGAVWYWGASTRQHSAVAPADVSFEPVAFLAAATGCEWVGAGPFFRTGGTGFREGQELTLLEGIAEFRLASGVALNMEGPASLVLHSPTSLSLEYGRLTCYVPWIVTDFQINAGQLQVAACDAECGVNVTPEEVSVHAFSGHVVITPSLHPDADPHESRDFDPNRIPVQVDSGGTVVVAGKAVQFDLAADRDGFPPATWHQADETQFATRLLMADELPVTGNYVRQVRAAKPVGYWRFESYEHGVIRNEVPDGADLKVEGTLRLSDSEVNRVAEFGRPGMDCFLTNSEPLGLAGGTDYTVELWIKPSHFHRAGVVSLMANPIEYDDGMHAFYLELQGAGMPGILSRENPGRTRILHRNPPGKQYWTGTSCFSEEPYLVRRWQHIVAVKQQESFRLYVDNEVMASGTDESPLPDDLVLLIGQAIYSSRTFPFVGQLDELAIYDRALTGEEIASHYNCVWSTGTRSRTSRDGTQLGI